MAQLTTRKQRNKMASKRTSGDTVQEEIDAEVHVVNSSTDAQDGRPGIHIFVVRPGQFIYMLGFSEMKKGQEPGDEKWQIEDNKAERYRENDDLNPVRLEPFDELLIRFCCLFLRNNVCIIIMLRVVIMRNGIAVIKSP